MLTQSKLSLKAPHRPKHRTDMYQWAISPMPALSDVRERLRARYWTGLRMASRMSRSSVILRTLLYSIRVLVRIRDYFEDSLTRHPSLSTSHHQAHIGQSDAIVTIVTISTTSLSVSTPTPARGQVLRQHRRQHQMQVLLQDRRGFTSIFGIDFVLRYFRY